MCPRSSLPSARAQSSVPSAPSNVKAAGKLQGGTRGLRGGLASLGVRATERERPPGLWRRPCRCLPPPGVARAPGNSPRSRRPQESVSPALGAPCSPALTPSSLPRRPGSARCSQATGRGGGRAPATHSPAADASGGL